jgi:acyl transferase domain-containing protein/acyl carrier protein
MATGAEDVVQALRTALKEAERLRAQNRRLLELPHEPLAIVGMGCRLPGDVTSPQGLWRLVSAGTDAIGPFPEDRGWNVERLYDPDPQHLGTSYAREGGFVYDAGEFDAGFFGISPRESLAMDPQQRLLLEGTWEALEDAGIDPASLKGSQTGVFVGVVAAGYGVVGVSTEGVDGYGLTGTTTSVASGRIAFTFGLEGPAVSVDTACSSSLVALHLACRAIHAGECSLALVGGVTVLATPGGFVEFSRQRGLAPDGRCKSFAAAADGTGFAEGMGMVVLERLSDARRNGREVLGLVRGSAVNQDGASNGLTAPNGPSQQRVIAQALANAKLQATQVDAVEAHGTGTTLGDPIEAQALIAAYGQSRPAGRPLWLGSVKSNIGHTQAAAGVTGVIKMVMAMRHGTLPQTLHVDQPTPEVDWSAGAISLLTEQQPWKRGSEPRRAGVSSFGVSGTNAHVILEEAPEPEPIREQAPGSANGIREQAPGSANGGLAEGSTLAAIQRANVLPWLLSAKSEAALRAQADRLRRHLSSASGSTAADGSQPASADIALTLARRSAFEHRAVLLVGEEGALEGLDALAAGSSAAGVIAGGAPAGEGGLACLFTGQGAQRVDMGRELYESFPVFRAALDEICAELDQHLPRPLREVLFADERAGTPVREDATDDSPPEQTSPKRAAAIGLIDQTAYAQAALFALEVALFRLVGTLGVRPDFLMGHSIGELSAAHVAGVFSLEDACRLVAARGRLMGELPAGGAMVSVQSSETDVRATLEGFDGRVAVAAVNGPAAVVISGDEDAVLEVERVWRARAVKTKRLQVSHAFHSHRMDGMLEAFAAVAQDISFSAPQIPIVSNVTGELISAEQICSAEYWVRHVREPVRFMDGVRWLGARGVRSFLEVGPEGVLSAIVGECLAGEPSPAAQSLLRGGRPEPATMLGALAEIWVHGGGVDWVRVFEGSGARRISLPTYAFQRERYWLARGAWTAGDLDAAGLGSGEHPLLKAAIPLADERGQLFTGRISQREPAWLADHVVLDECVVPGVFFVELALHAAGQLGCDLLEELVIELPLVLGEREEVQLQVMVDAADEDGRRSVKIHSRAATAGDGEDEGAWTRHASGVLAFGEAGDPAARERAAALAETGMLAAGECLPASVETGMLAEGERLPAAAVQVWPPEGAIEIDVDDFYDHVAALGFAYGPAFFGVRSVWRRGEEVFTELSLAERERHQAHGFGLHPALLDAALQGGLTAASSPEGEELDKLRLPFSFNDVRLFQKGVSELRVCLSRTAEDGLSLVGFDEAGGLVVSLGSLAVRSVSREQILSARGDRSGLLFGVSWDELDGAARAAHRWEGSWVAVGAEGGGLRRAMERGGVGGGAGGGEFGDFEALSRAVDGGLEAPELVVLDCAQLGESSVDGGGGDGGAGAVDVIGSARGIVAGVLGAMQAWVADERFAASRLVLVSEGATAVAPGDDLDGLAQSPVWGLVRCAQAEHPGRLVLIDVDGKQESWEALSVALVGGESQVAIRSGRVLVPRLTRSAPAPSAQKGAGRAGRADPMGTPREGVGALRRDGTVLITGGTGALGALVARHLVADHDIGGVLLVSRRGRDAPGAGELEASLVELGAEVRIAACDVSDRVQLRELLAAIPEERPLCGVVHAAGVIEDAVIESLTVSQLERVLAPKLDAAWHLHELTEHLDLSMFVVCSSVVATFGSPGQGDYGAANAFMDALAAYRRARGLAGTSVAWGLWDLTGGMAGELDQADRARMAHFGVSALSPREGLECFDAASAVDRALVVAGRLDVGMLRARAEEGVLPPLFSRLAGGSHRARRERGERRAGALAQRLAGVSEAEREGVVLELVLSEIARVLGHASPAAIDRGQVFTELGLDSLAALELRNTLSEATGLRLSATLVFDYPTPEALAGYLLEEVAGSSPQSARTTVPASRPAIGREEPIAIVGIGCRFPGGARSPEDLWELLASGTDAISAFPRDRGWDLERLYHPDPANPGTFCASEGGFIHDAGDFDAAFFGISPREALAMDPHQRLLLETAWEALEDAGIDPHTLRGSQTGVFAGVSPQGYDRSMYGPAAEGLHGYMLTGTTGSVASGRVAYVLGLEGPTMTIDTACSSSMVALHLASGALRGGECEFALAGGASVMSSPVGLVEFSTLGASAPDSRSKSYSDAANGTGWSEGAGMLLLERLSDAQRSGREVLAVIRGSAVNQDGASNGLTAPNGPSQRRVIAAALASARLSPMDVDAVEGHGTGTELGDPIEIRALQAAYGQDRPVDRPLWLGSIKSNIGHAAAAAGTAGVIKIVMAMRRGVLPQTLHVEQPSSHVDWSSARVSLLKEARPWGSNGKPRRAGVSSFGISGTNVHVILEEAPQAAPAVPRLERPLLSAEALEEGGALALSGKGRAALRMQAKRLHEHLECHPELEMVDVGYSLVSGRSMFRDRAVVLGGGRGGLLGGLGVLAGGEVGVGVVRGVADVGRRVAFLFPGQGSQWVGMAVGLLDGSAVFAESVGLCGEALAPFVDWSLEGVLRGVEGAPGLDRVDVVQPVLWAVMVSLAELWRSCGVRPDVVVGHSQGEIAAACVAGGLSLGDGACVVALRSRALAGLAGRGGMVSVALSVGELERCLEGWGCVGVSVAAVNGPGATVVSGEVGVLEELLGVCEGDGVRARRIPVDYASHSPQIEEIRGELLEACASIVPRSGEVPFFSTVVGGVVDMAELGGEYWYRNLRETVRFEGAVRSLLGDGYRAFVEVSPHPVLTIGVQEAVEDVLGGGGGALVSGSLRRGEGGGERWLRSLAEVWVRGVGVDWERVFEGAGGRRVKLPTYAFQRERYWLQGSPGMGDMSSVGLMSSVHPLLGAMVDVAADEQWLFTGQLSVQRPEWLADHLVYGTPVVPGTTFVELALHAGSRVDCGVLEELVIEAPLVLATQAKVALQVAVGELDESGRRSVTVSSRRVSPEDDVLAREPWTRHASGVLVAGELAAAGRVRANERVTASLAAEAWPPPGARAISIDDLYDEVAARGIEYGPAFSVLRAAWWNGEELLAEIALDDREREEASAYGAHPALLDGALQLMGAALLGGGPAGEAVAPGGAFLPFSFGGVEVHVSGASSLRVSLLPLSSDTLSLVMADGTGRLVAAIDSLTMREVSVAQLGSARGASEDALYTLDWEATASSPFAESATESLILLGAERSALAEALREDGQRIEVHPDLDHLREALQEGGAAPDAVFIDCEAAGPSGALDLSVVHHTAHRVLELAQNWLSDDRFADSRLVLITRGAIVVDPATDAADGLAMAPVWGLVRSAQAESPERFVLLDIDRETSGGALHGALHEALASHESQLVLRCGALAVPRLRALASSAAPEDAVGEERHAGTLDPDGTALITGGTGTLGGLLARHLVRRHGARRLLLVSRGGAQARGAAELRAELEELGATVQIAACDVSDREALKALVDTVPAEHPLTAVVHAAGLLDGGLIGSMTAERVDRALAPKADAAWHLHELTRDAPLGAFVLFSSAAGLLGGAGQASYAAANAFLDALAAHRRALGLPASSIAWGLWEGASAMTENLSEADRRRVVGLGMRELSHEQGLALFDRVLDSRQVLVLAATLDLRVLRAQARMGGLAGMLSGLVRLPKGRSGEREETLAERLAAVPEAEREGVVRDLVRANVAMVLGHDSPEEVEERRAFKELGFDSLSAVELRNRLNTVTGLRLPVTLIFDYSTPEALAEHLLGQVSIGDAIPANGAAGPALIELDKLERILSAPALDDLEREQITRRLRALIAGVAGDEATMDDDLDASTAEEVFAAMDREFGNGLR